jgi:hypothetical protein
MHDIDSFKSMVKGCGLESAKALKRILGLLDKLNKDDLRLLADVVERLLCSKQNLSSFLLSNPVIGRYLVFRT